MQSHEPFPDMDSFQNKAQIVTRFSSGHFLKIKAHLLNCVTHNCWAGKYDSADAVLHNLTFKS